MCVCGREGGHFKGLTVLMCCNYEIYLYDIKQLNPCVLIVFLFWRNYLLSSYGRDRFALVHETGFFPECALASTA